MKWTEWEEKIQNITQRFLTWRKRRRLYKKEKQKRKNTIRDWVEALLWAAFFVLLLNQYLIQAYAIPSSSMEQTLKIEDRLFVDKLVYGPELIPGNIKFSGLRDPQRGEIIIFENPRYKAKFPLFEIIDRIIYMITFSLVNLDIDETTGQPAHHFLVKRLMGMPGDRIRHREGYIEIMPTAEDSWLKEKEIKARLDFDYKIQKLFDYSEYEKKEKSIVTMTLNNIKLEVPQYYQVDVEGNTNIYTDIYYDELILARTKYELRPHQGNYRSEWTRENTGWFIPYDRFFPMGDNRDNSKDGRRFNPVSIKKILGRALFRFWPLGRMGVI